MSRIRNTEDAKGVDVNFDDLVVTGGSVEALRIDTCTGHVSSEFIKKHISVYNLPNVSNHHYPTCGVLTKLYSRSLARRHRRETWYIMPGITALH